MRLTSVASVLPLPLPFFLGQTSKAENLRNKGVLYTMEFWFFQTFRSQSPIPLKFPLWKTPKGRRFCLLCFEGCCKDNFKRIKRGLKQFSLLPVVSQVLCLSVLRFTALVLVLGFGLFPSPSYFKAHQMTWWRWHPALEIYSLKMV